MRRATSADLDQVVSLRLALLREHPNHPVYGRLHPEIDSRARELFARQLRDEGEAIFLAESDKKVVGIVRCVEMIGSPLLEPARYAYVSSAYVLQAHRQQGALRALISKVEEWASARNLDQLRLHNVDGSESAVGAWSALGFEVVEQVRVRALRKN